LLDGLAEHLRSSFRSGIDDFVTTAFPSDCRVCNGPLLRATVLPICDRCRASVPKQTDALCQRCGEALDIDMESARFAGGLPVEGLLCYACRAVPPRFERAVAYAVYESELREMVHLLKYERMGGVAKLLGGMLAATILTLRAEAARELTVVAVPLFPAKQRQRGYNQAELLADAAIATLRRMAPEWKLERAPGVLSRRRDTMSQFELNPRGRRRNLEGAFAVEAGRLVPGCEVLLVDDIYTTGATARECARVLRRAGARKVWVATLARAQTPRVALWDGAMQTPQGFG
jgi:ComF family protein